MFYLPSSLNIPQISRLEGDCFLGLGYLGIIPCFLESFSFFVKYTSYVKPFVNSVVNFHVTLRPRFQQPANFVSSAFTSSCPVGRPPVYTSAFYVEWKVPEGWVMTRSPFVSPLSGTPYVLGVCTIVYLWTRWTGELIRARLLQTELQRRGWRATQSARTHDWRLGEKAASALPAGRGPRCCQHSPVRTMLCKGYLATEGALTLLGVPADEQSADSLSPLSWSVSWLQFRSSFFPGKRKEAQWAAAAGSPFTQGRPSSVSRVHRGCLWQCDYLFDDLFHKGAVGWVAVDGAQLYKESTGNIIKFS